MERVNGIGPSYAAWKAAVLPLNYTRIGDSEGNRTLDPLIKSQLLYHLSYRVIVCSRASGQTLFPTSRPTIGSSANKMVETGGFEPPNPEGADLQSAAFSHFATSPQSADNRNRTYNLLITNQLLCQLSYVGII